MPKNHYISHINYKNMQDLFSFEKDTVISTKDKKEAKALKLEDKQKLRMSVRDDNFRKIMREVGGLPKKGEIIAIKTNGTSDCGSIFSYILENWETVEDCYIATWTISRANVTRIRSALEAGKIKSLTMVFSSTLKPANPALYSNLILQLKHFPQVKLKEINSHAKTFSITNGKDFLTVSGSANWSENPRIENFLILNNKELYKHHEDWMSELAQLK